MQSNMDARQSWAKGLGKRGDIVAGILLPMMFLGAVQTGKHLLRAQNVSEQNQKHFCIPDTKFVSATNVARAGKRGNICVGNDVSSFARALKNNLLSSIKRRASTLAARM